MADKPIALARPLRLVLVWHGDPLEEKVLHTAEPVVLGCHKGVTFAIPEGSIGAEYTLLRPSPDGSFTLCLTPGMTGTLGIDRREIPVAEFLSQGRVGPIEQPLAVNDWGMVAIDGSQEIAIFFQFLPPSVGLGPGAGFMDRFIGQALVFSAVVHISLLVIAFILWEPEDGLDIDPPPSTAIAKLLMEPPPEPEKKEKADPRKAREDDASKKAAKKEGKIGDKDAKPVATKIPKGDRDQIAKAVSTMGLLGTLKQGKQSAALKSLLSDTDATVTTAMAGLKGTELVVGRGGGGMGIKGEGPGGGGTGKGQLMGVGNLAVGGGGKGGKNTGTGGGSRVVKEMHVGMTTGNLSSEGGLSKEQINQVVNAHKAALQYCYDKELQRFPHLAGTVKLYWRVEPDGKVSTVRVDNSTLGNPSAEGCMSRQVKAWTFPKSNGMTNVNFPFVFRGQ